jgi:hypothetical protein
MDFIEREGELVLLAALLSDELMLLSVFAQAANNRQLVTIIVA